MLCNGLNIVTRIVDSLCNTGWVPTTKHSVQRQEKYEMTFDNFGTDSIVIEQRTVESKIPNFILRVDQAGDGFAVQDLSFRADGDRKPRISGNCGCYNDLLEFISGHHYRSLPEAEIVLIDGQDIPQSSILRAWATNNGQIIILTADGRTLKVSQSFKTDLNVQGVYVKPVWN